MPTANKRVVTFQLVVFAFWIGSLLAGLIVYVTIGFCCYFNVGSASDAEWFAATEDLMRLILPQLAIIATIFLAAGPDRRADFALHGHRATVALVCSAIYHGVFWLLLLIGVAAKGFGGSLPGDTDKLVTIMGWMTVLGVGPVTYLFSQRD